MSVKRASEATLTLAHGADVAPSKRPKHRAPPLQRSMKILIDFPISWLSSLLQFCDCRATARFGATCRAARAVESSAQSTRAGFASALSTKRELAAAIEEAVNSCSARLGPAPSLAFIFLSASYPHAEIGTALAVLEARLPASCVLMGCHGMGILGRDCVSGKARECELGERAVSLVLLHAPELVAVPTFVRIEDIHKQCLAGRDSDVSDGVSDEAKIWLREALHLTPDSSTAAFVLLCSPSTLVSNFLQVFRSAYPFSQVTGALASGGRPQSIALFTKHSGAAITQYTNGIACLEIKRRVRTDVDTVREAPPMTAFASRGCKACSSVYQIISTDGGSLVKQVRLVRTLEDERADTEEATEQQILRRLIGDRTDQQPQQSSPRAARAHRSFPLSLSPSRSTESVEVLDVLRSVMTRCENADGYINGLFVGVSDESVSAEGRVLCDILEVQSDGIKLDVDVIRIHTNADTDGDDATLSLEGKYLQFFELNPSACMIDLANRVRTSTKAKQIQRVLLERLHSLDTAGTVSPYAVPRPLGALLFTCAGRGSAFFHHPDVDSEILRAQSGMHVAGFFCNGEIGPAARSLQVMKPIEQQALVDASHQPQSGSDGDCDEHETSEPLSLQSNPELYVLPPTNAASPPVIQSFTAVVTVFASQW